MNRIPNGRPGRRSAAERGFTMIELLITLVVTVFGIMGIMALHTSLTKGATYAGQAQEAIAVGSQVMEKLRAVRPSELDEAVMGLGGASVPYSATPYATVLGRNGLSYTVNVAVTDVIPTLWRVRIEVSWVDDATNTTRMLPVELLRSSRESL